MNTEYLSNSMKKKILNCVKVDKTIEHVILFGSFAYGNPGKNSDLDLVFILKNEEKANSYTEKWNRYIRISRLLKDLSKHYPIDLLLYTIDEWNTLLETNTSFTHEIKTKGIVLQ